MKRLNFTLDDETAALLETLASKLFGGNKSLAVRSAVESLAAHSGHVGWVISGFTPVQLDEETACHCCQESFKPGATLYRPVFEKGVSPQALEHLPSSQWLDCETCAGGHL